MHIYNMHACTLIIETDTAGGKLEMTVKYSVPNNELGRIAMAIKIIEVHGPCTCTVTIHTAQN